MPALNLARPGSDRWRPLLLRWPSVARHGDEEWRPVLLPDPGATHGSKRDWKPLVIRPDAITTLGLLAIFLALQFLIPARLVIGGMGAVGRPSVAVGILLVFLWLLSAIRSSGLPRGRQPIRWVVGLFLAVQLVGYVVGMDRLPTAGQASAADRWMILTLAMCGVMLAVADGIRTRRELDRLLRWLVFFACVMSLVGILQFLGLFDLTTLVNLPGLAPNSDLLGVSSRGTDGVPRVAGTANHYIEFGVVLALALPLALHYAFFSPPGLARLRWWSAVALIASGIPLSVSRSAVVTLLVVMVFMGVVWPWRQRRNVLILGALALLVFYALNREVLTTLWDLFTLVEEDPSITARLDDTAQVMSWWHERPLLGWGAGMVTPGEFRLLDNQWYMFLVAGGVAGVLAFCVLLVVPYALGRSVRLRGRDQETRHLGHALAVTMPAAFVASGTFDSLSFATFTAVLCVVVGAIGALWRLDGTAEMRPLRHARPGDGRVVTPVEVAIRSRIRQAREASCSTVS